MRLYNGERSSVGMYGSSDHHYAGSLRTAFTALAIVFGMTLAGSSTIYASETDVITADTSVDIVTESTQDDEYITSDDSYYEPEESYTEPIVYEIEYEPAAEEPVYEEPVYEEPVYEEPVYEEPVYEEPVYEEPVNEEPVYVEPVYEEPVPEQPPAEEEPVIKPPEQETPTPEQPPAEVQPQEPETEGNQDPEPTITPTPPPADETGGQKEEEDKKPEQPGITNPEDPVPADSKDKQTDAEQTSDDKGDQKPESELPDPEQIPSEEEREQKYQEVKESAMTPEIPDAKTDETVPIEAPVQIKPETDTGQGQHIKTGIQYIKKRRKRKRKASPPETRTETAEEISTDAYSYSSAYALYSNPVPQVSVYDLWYSMLTEDQRMHVGMTKTTKTYGIVNGLNDTPILESRDPSAKKVGQVPSGGLVYVLEDTGDGWYYIESGSVRGFVLSALISTGKEADDAVAKAGENTIPQATALCAASENGAYYYSKKTVMEVPASPGGTMSDVYSSQMLYRQTVDRQSILRDAMQYVGRPYVWGGEDLWNGTDCSGFTRGIFAHFGIPLPRCSYEQCYVGKRIRPEEALPGDLLFYAEEGQVHHVLIYAGNGKCIEAKGKDYGIVYDDVNYNKVCWGCRYFIGADDYDGMSTQATDYVSLGAQASNGDKASQQAIIEVLAASTTKEWQKYGFCPSVLIAQVIQESGWLSFTGAGIGGIQPMDNNVLGMNESLLNERWTSPWTGTAAMRVVPQYVAGSTVYGAESMRTYEDIEACMMDYAAFKIGLHPELQGVTDIDAVINIGLEGYATDPGYQESIKRIITNYDLTKYDVAVFETEDYATAPAVTFEEEREGVLDVSEEEDPFMDLVEDYGDAYEETEYVPLDPDIDYIASVVAALDNSGYNGSLAVVSVLVNRAAVNYHGYGKTVMEQIKGSSDFFFGERISDGVNSEVVRAVEAAIESGVRNHSYKELSKTSVQDGLNIGKYWYY